MDKLSPFDPIDGKPVTIVFGSFNYRDTIRKWINHTPSSCDHWRIVCIDQELVGWLNEIGHGNRAVYFYDLFPDTPKHDPNRKLAKHLFTTMRPKLWRALADSGRDFIHSDADALWLQDPRAWLAQHTEFDLLISQGTIYPASHYFRHLFVLCAGFFFCRSNARTQNYFRRVEEAKNIDQLVMNELLLYDPEATWQIRRPSLWFAKGHYSQIWQTVPALIKNNIGIWILRLISKPLRRLKLGSDCIIQISPDIIRGRFSGGLTVGMIPMHLVTRINGISSNNLMVEHVPQNRPMVKSVAN